MRTGGDTLNKNDIKELREFHKKQLKDGWLEIKEGNYRNRYRYITTQNNVAIQFQSYYSDVCYLEEDNGVWFILKTWNAWSATTQRALNMLFDQLGIPHMNKKMWDNLPWEEWAVL